MCQSVMAAISSWHHHRLYLALDTTVLWNRFCIIHLSIVCCGRAIPFLWKVKEHKSAERGFWGIQVNVEGTHIDYYLIILISCSWQIEDLLTMS